MMDELACALEDMGLRPGGGAPSSEDCERQAVTIQNLNFNLTSPSPILTSNPHSQDLGARKKYIRRWT